MDKFEAADNYTQNPAVLNLINSYHFDFIISPLGKNFTIQFLKSTNAKHIIVRNKISSIFSLKCKVVWHGFVKKFAKCSFEDALLYFYARKIDPKLFDSKIKSLNFDIMIKTKEQNKNKIKAFLQENKLKNFIIINPFCISAQYILFVKDFLKLIQEFHKKYPKIQVVIPTYEAVHSDFIKEVKEFDESLLSWLCVFKNDENLLNLCELIKHSKLHISLSTGTIHLASNLKIESIGLFSKRDSEFWETFNKDYVILEKPRACMSEEEIQELINQVLSKIEKYVSQETI